jgi:CHAT domain-containing protein
MSTRFAAGTDALAALVRERQDAARRWQQLDAIMTKAAGEPKRRNAETEATLRQQLATASGELNTLDARLQREFPAYVELSNPEPLEVSEVQALLTPDEAMIVYFIGSNKSWLWALRRDQARVYRLELGVAELTATVKAMRERLDISSISDIRDLLPFDAQRSYGLYEKLLAPAAPVLEGAHRLLVVPDGDLGSLPLGVLVTQAPKTNPERNADHRKIAWLGKEYALAVLPSVSSLRALRTFATAGRAPSPFAGIGDPVLAGGAEARLNRGRSIKLAGLFRGAVANVDAVRSLPSLSETATELRAVAAALGVAEADLYLGPRATEPAIRQATLDRYRVIEFATHGLVSGDLEGLAEPALVLTPPETAGSDDDGLLTASEVATLKLNADWVVLSACNTAASDGTPDAGGLSGLARAFFFAGARSVLVSHWPAASEPTVTLVTTAVEELNKNPSIGRAEALRRAEMAMLDPKYPDLFAHPAIWAPFVLAGEGGAAR